MVSIDCQIPQGTKKSIKVSHALQELQYIISSQTIFLRKKKNKL